MTTLKNRAGVSTATTGTGTITLGAALGAVAPNLASWQTWASAGLVDGDTTRYLILDNDAWEYGPTIYTAAGTTITRPAGLMDGTVAGQKSSTSSLLNLSGSAQVFIAAIAEDLIAGNPASGFLANKNGTDQNVTSAAVTVLTWSTESYDINNEFASDTFTPVNAGYYQFDCAAHVTAIGVGTTSIKLHLYKNGALAHTLDVVPSSLSNVTLQGSVTISAAASDAFTLRIEFVGLASGTATVEGDATDSWFNSIREAGASGVMGPTSSTDNAIARFNGTTGSIIQDSLTTIDDNGSLRSNTTSGSNFVLTGNASPQFQFQPTASSTKNANISQFSDKVFIDNSSAGIFVFDLLTGFSGVGLGIASAARSWCVVYDSSATNTVSYLQRLTSTSTGTPAVGIGAGMEFEVETAAGNNEIGATIEAVAYTVTSTAEAFTLNGKQMAAGALQESFGVSFLEKVITANVAYSSVNTVQPWFPSGGAVTLEGSTTYEFEGILAVQTTGASTTHTTGLSFTGTATLTSIAYNCESHYQLANTTMTTATAVLSSRTYVTQASNTTVSGLSGTTSAQQQVITVRGIIRVNAAGTVIPNFTFSAAPGAGNVLANTFFKLRKLGSNTVVNQGNWA